MKELKIGEIIQQHFPLSRSRDTKRWVTAEKRKNYNEHHIQNLATETAYHRVINLAKTFMQPGETYFERDYKQDHTEGLYGMHCMLTPNFYWRLDCKFTYDYEVTYAFNNCSYETEIRKLMRAYPLDRAAIEKQLQPDFDAFYSNVLSVQEDKYFHSLTR